MVRYEQRCRFLNEIKQADLARCVDVPENVAKYGSCGIAFTYLCGGGDMMRSCYAGWFIGVGGWEG